MMSLVTMTRRTALLASATAALATLPASCAAEPAARQTRRASGTVRDRLWIWGHGPHTLDGDVNLPDGPVLGEVPAALALGVPGLAVIRWSGKPAKPFGPFIKRLSAMGQVGWSVVDNSPEPTAEKIDTALALADRVPNLTTLWLDDLFILPMKITPKELADLRTRAHARPKPLDLAAVLYATQLTDAGVDLSPLEQMDVVSLWTWDGADIDRLPDIMAEYRRQFPTKRTMLGLYMWDFGGAAPIGVKRMRRQLDLALGWLRSGEIEGVVFHSTPLVARSIAEVGMAKRWIARHGSTQLRA